MRDISDKALSLRRDHRPFFLKKAYLNFQQAYARIFLAPQLDRLGTGYMVIHPWNIEVFGAPISIGSYANILSSSDKKVRFTVWPEEKGKGAIDIGDYCLISPGVRISSADHIRIGSNTMIASHAYITDSDWHGVYNRVWTIGPTEPVSLGDNVWIGDSAIVCKGVSIGDNSIIGAGSVVVRSIPANTVAVGNPARVVKELDPEQPFARRSEWFADPAGLKQKIEDIDRDNLRDNSLLHWIRTLLFPRSYD